MCLFKSGLMSFVAPCNFSKKLFLMTAKQAYLTRYRNSIFLFNVKHELNGIIYNPGHNPGDILTFDKIFVSPQVKRIVIIGNKNGIYELPHESPNDLRLRTLGN